MVAAAKVGGIKANNDFPVEFLVENLKIQNNLIEASHASGVAKLHEIRSKTTTKISTTVKIGRTSGDCQGPTGRNRGVGGYASCRNDLLAAARYRRADIDAAGQHVLDATREHEKAA